MTANTEQARPVTCYNTGWEDNFNLAVKLSRKIKESGYSPDLILAISRGGLVPARIIADFLLERNIQCLHARRWGVGEQIGEKVAITGTPADLQSKNVLVVDDVADTGDTLQEITRYLHRQKVRNVKTATLHYKKTSTCKPDYYAAEMEQWQWIVYPWSIYEDATHFIKEIIKARPLNREVLQEELAYTYNLQLNNTLYNLILREMKKDNMITEEDEEIHPGKRLADSKP